MSGKRFYNSAGELDGRLFTRTYAEEVASALSAVDSALGGEPAVYASSELTTGKRAYALMRELGVGDLGELRQRVGEGEFQRRIWDPNHAEAVALAHALHGRLGTEVVVTPAPFVAPGWTQPEYLAFWETLIRTRVKAVHLGVDWEYSFGCAFEFTVAQDAGIPTFDEEGGALDLQAGTTRIAAAVAAVEAAGMDAGGLRENLERLARLRASA